MDLGKDVADASTEDARTPGCRKTSATQMSGPGPIWYAVGPSNGEEGCSRDDCGFVSKNANLQDDSNHRQVPTTAGDSLLSADGSGCSTMSIDTITFVAGCVDPPMSTSRDEEVPTPPLPASRHGKFKKSLEDRFRGQGTEYLSPSSISTLSPVASGLRKSLHVECAPSGGRNEGDRDRKSRSMDESDRRSRSMDEGGARGSGIRSNSFDPGTTAVTLSEDSPLDLSRSAAVGAITASSSSSVALTDRDVCRSLFEARARERHLRKRSESEENIRWPYDRITSAVVPRSALGRLCYSDAQIDQSGLEMAEGMAAGGMGSEFRHDVARNATGSHSQQLAVASANFVRQRRQKSSSPSAGRSLQQRRSPKAYSSLDDGSPSVPSDDDGRPAGSSSGSRSLSAATTVRPSSAEGPCSGTLSPGWRMTPSPYQAGAPVATGDRTSSPVQHSPGARAASADDPAAATSGSLDDPAAGSPGTARLHFCHVCDRSFSRSDMLTRHVRLHTGLKPYECQLCGQLFSRSDHLSTHQRTHTGERPYRCPHCPYAACRRDMITRHLRVHGRSSSGGCSSEDDGSCSLATGAAAAAAGTAVTSTDVKAKRRRLLQRGPWSSSGGSSSSAAAGDGSSSWDSSSYSFGSSSIESSCGGGMDVTSAAAAAAAAAYGLGGGSSAGGGGAWLQAPRMDPGRIWRWSSNGSSSGSSSSGLGLSVGCSSPDVGSTGRSAVITTATTTLPPFADSWADACDRAGLLGDASIVLAGRQQAAAAAAAAAALPAVTLERSTPGGGNGGGGSSMVGSKLAQSTPVWASTAMLPFGYGRPLAAGPMPAAAAAALLCATQPQALALFTGGAGAGSSSGVDCLHGGGGGGISSNGRGGDDAAVSAGGSGDSEQAVTCSGSGRSKLGPTEGSSAAAAAAATAAKERKSLVRQDASMEQEDEPSPVVVADTASISTCLPALLPPLQQQQSQLHKSLLAGVWLDYPLASRGAPPSALVASPCVTTAAAVSVTMPRLASSAVSSIVGGGGGLAAPRQASLSDELGKVTMSE